MPELPEVETIRTGLARHLPGKTVAKVTVSVPKLLANTTPQDFSEALLKQSYTRLRRLGKILIIDLESVSLLVRLGMTGQLTFRDPSRPDQVGFTRHPITGLERAVQHAPDKHTHIILEHRDATQLVYRDIRKFGHWYLYPSEQVSQSPQILSLGPDPFDPAYTLETFSGNVLRKPGPIKAVLLNQSVVAGIGNIYADELLFQAHIRPSLPARELTPAQVADLFRLIPEILSSAIANRGTTFSDYRDSEGNPGDNAAKLLAYGRHGQPCLVCGTTMLSEKLGGRTSSWCPHCQV